MSREVPDVFDRINILIDKMEELDILEAKLEKDREWLRNEATKIRQDQDNRND